MLTRRLSLIIWVSLVLVCAWHGAGVSGAETNCLFKDCKCTKNIDNSLDILCISTNDDSLFPTRVENYTGNYSLVNTFLIKRYKFKQIPDEAFRDLEIRNLIIGENSMEKLALNSFRAIKSLQLLRIIEKNFEIIEDHALDWIQHSLIELGLWQLNFVSEHIDSFFEQLGSLYNVRTLNLMGYNLIKFKPEWTRVFVNVSSLSLASNDLKVLPVDLFTNATHLVSLDLSNNFLTNLTNVFQAIKPIGKHLKELKLYGNTIENLLDFPAWESLESLDLSNNKIHTIYESSFYNLQKIRSLFLSNNLIGQINDQSFYSLAQIHILLLNNNYLNKVPNITTLNKLKILDLSNQNGNLKEIQNYAFERDKQLLSPLSIHLDLNEIEIIHDRAFCNRHSNISEINNLELSYASAKRMEKCILKQLSSLMSSRVSLNIGLYMQSFNESSDLCNCDYKAFTQRNKIDLIGGCLLLVDNCVHKSDEFNDDCAEKAQFDCDLIEDTNN